MSKLKLLFQKILCTQLSSVIKVRSPRLVRIYQPPSIFSTRSFKLICAGGFAATTQLLWLPQSAQSQSVLGSQCAAPGKDGIDPGVISIVNTYYSGPDLDTVISQGSTTIPLGAINSQGNQTTIAPGDLLLVIQMQDADINFTDTANYGAGTGTGAGASAINNTGFYEYVVAQGNITAGTLKIRGTGAGGGLINSYRQQAADITSHGKRSYQIVRVPQFISTTLTGTLRSPGSWNGKSGGIVAIDVVNTLTMAGGTIEAQDKGFRGGGGTTNTDTYPDKEDEAFRTDGNVPRGGVKGEGIAGTPLYVFDGSTTTNTGIDGYPRLKSADTYPTIGGNVDGGSRARGAPGNAGGGGNMHNSGGGGGGNSGAGGNGGNSIKKPDSNYNQPNYTEVMSTGASKPVGGRGGAVFPITIVPTIDRLIMGGGGGAGDANNGIAGSGGLGGGIIMIRAGTITGTGTISARARDGVVTPTDDGGSGAGAGGSILILAKGGSLANISLDARGGKGGDTNTAKPISYDFGPGGGGGGGAIFSSIPTGMATVNGGDPGKSFNGQLGTMTTGVTRGATAGSPGNVTAGTAIGSAQIPGILSGADCNAKVLIVKRITEIQANRNANPNDLSHALNQAIDRPSFAADDPFPTNNWPSNFLVGAYDAGQIKPGDIVEYTIYFLNSSGMNAKNVRICDQIFGSQTFVNDAYGAVGSGKDIEYKLGNNSIRYLTSSVNTAVDRAQLDSSTGTIANCPAPTISGTNNGTVVIDITGTSSVQDTLLSLPSATGQGTANSYGYFRFKTKINP
jgi:uncharacterized repeat protein (TIGR01451 family)